MPTRSAVGVDLAVAVPVLPAETPVWERTIVASIGRESSTAARRTGLVRLITMRILHRGSAALTSTTYGR